MWLLHKPPPFPAGAAGVCGGRGAVACSGRPNRRARTPPRTARACGWSLPASRSSKNRPTWPHIGYDFAAISTVTARCGSSAPRSSSCRPSPTARGCRRSFSPRASRSHRRLHRLPDEQLGPGDADHRRLGQADSGGRFPYAGSGGFLVYTAGLRRTHKNFSVVASSKIEDLAAAAKCFEVAQAGAVAGRVRRRLRPRPPASGRRPSATAACKDDPLQVADSASVWRR